LDQEGEYAGVNWSTAGVEFEDNPDYDLIPLAEEPRNASEPQLQEFFEQVLDRRMAKLEAQYAKTEDWVEGYQEAFDELERRIEEDYNDCIARINGLRNDERIAVLEERLEKLLHNNNEDAIAFFELKERLEKLEAYNSRLDLWREDQEAFTEATWLRMLQIERGPDRTEGNTQHLLDLQRRIQALEATLLVLGVSALKGGKE
jgi:tetratricopeptide (TPR) repeat protein